MSSDTNTRLHCDVLCGANALFVLEAEWRALDARCPEATLFQSFTWCSSALSQMDENDRRNIRIYTLRETGDLVALLPMRIQRKTGRTLLSGFAEPFQEFTDMLLDPQVNAEQAYRMLHGEVLKEKVDYIHYGQVRDDSALARGMGDLVPAGGEPDAAPYVRLADYADYETFLKSVRTKTRKNMRNMRNVLERTAPITHEVTLGPDGTPDLLERTFANRAEWLEERGLNSAAFDDGHFIDVLRRLAGTEEPGFQSVGMSLRHGDEIMAEMWGFLHKGRYYAYMSHWNADYAAKSPGRMHLGYVLEEVFAMGGHSAEFMMPAVPYKMTWATDQVVTMDHLLALTPVGRLYCGLWIDKLRPKVKSLAYAMPALARRQVWATVNTLRGRG